MWVVRPSEAVTRAAFYPDVSPAGEDSGIVLLVRHGRITHCPAGRTARSLFSLCTHLQPLSLRCMHDLDYQSKTAGVINPSALRVNSQGKYSLAVSFKICKVALKIILC